MQDMVWSRVMIYADLHGGQNVYIISNNYVQFNNRENAYPDRMLIADTYHGHAKSLKQGPL